MDDGKKVIVYIHNEEENKDECKVHKFTRNRFNKQTETTYLDCAGDCGTTAILKGNQLTIKERGDHSTSEKCKKDPEKIVPSMTEEHKGRLKNICRH